METIDDLRAGFFSSVACWGFEDSDTARYQTENTPLSALVVMEMPAVSGPMVPSPAGEATSGNQCPLLKANFLQLALDGVTPAP